MVTTRRQSLGASLSATDPPAETAAKTPARKSGSAAKSQSWAESHGTGDRSGVWGLSGGIGALVSLAGTLALMSLSPAFAIYLCVIFTKMDGSVLEFWGFAQREGLQGLYGLWPRPSLEAWTYIAGHALIQAALQLLMPGKAHKGPITPAGNVPVYKANGLQSYFTTLVLFFLGWRLQWFSPGRVYDLFPEIIAALNIFSLAFCVFLYVKGHFAPSSSDSGSTGSLVYDFYWGMELYPRLGQSFDLKTWTNCRMGMMGWAVIILCYAAKQLEATGGLADSMLVSVALMQIYIAKFFLWETGYWASMDIMHDRAGYYICWGCLVWVPSVYTSPAMYLVAHPVHLGTPLALAMFAAGAAAVYVNYDSDRQRVDFRASGGKQLVWGAKPVSITAHYTTGDGVHKTSKLLASGWWGLARHFHYVPEITAAFLWTAPGLFGHALPYFYVFFLTLLLTDRAFRDDIRCRAKYGANWDAYCKLVPYKMLPGVW